MIAIRVLPTGRSGGSGIRRLHRSVRLLLVLSFTGAMALLTWSLPVASAQETQEAAASDANKEAMAIFADAASFQNNRAFPLAIEEWKKLIDRYPESPLVSQAWHYLGVCLIQLEPPKIEDAIEAFRHAVSDKDLQVRAESLINLGWCLYMRARSADPSSADRSRDLNEAGKVLESFLEQYPRSRFVDQALFYLGEIHSLQGKSREAVDYYRRLLNNQPSASSPLRADALYALEAAYEELGDRRSAEQTAQAFLKEFPKHQFAPEMRVRLADLLIKKQEFAGAITLLQQAIDTAGGGSLLDYAWLRKAYALSKLDRDDEAVQALEQSLARFPDSPHRRARHLLAGQIHFRNGRYEAAIDHLKKVATDRDQPAITAVHLLAQAYMKVENYAAALEVAERAVEWLPRDASVIVRIDRAESLYGLAGRLPDAYQAYADIATEFADHELAPRAFYNAAFIALQLQRWDDAQRWATEFLRRFPNDTLRDDVAYIGAETLLLQGKYDESIRAYETLLKVATPDRPEYPAWVLRLATAYYLADRFADAIALLEKNMSKFVSKAQQAEAWFLLGASHFYEQRLEQAVEQLQRSLALSDQWDSADEAMLMLADAFRQQQQYDQARATLNGFLKRFPQSPHRAQAEYQLAQLLADAGQYDRATELYQRILDNEKASALHRFARYATVRCLMQQERYEPALEMLQQLKRDDADDSIAIQAKLAEGICLRKLGRLDAAINTLKLLANRNIPPAIKAAALHELGLALTERKDLKEAIAAYQECLDADPEYPARMDVLYDLAWNLHETGQRDESAKRFSELVQQYPRSERAAEAYLMIGNWHYDQERFANAEASFQRALAAAPPPEIAEKAWYKLGWSLYEQEKYADAFKAFQEQVKRFPDGELIVDGQFMLGECARELDRPGDAVAAYTAAAERMEKGHQPAAEAIAWLVYLHAAQCEREQKRYAQAAQWLSKIADPPENNPDRDAILFETAWVKYLQGDNATALKMFENVAERYRNEVGARARFMMGEIFFAEKRFDEAIPQFQRVMYGYGAEKAPPAIRTWQAQSAIEAARCSEALAGKLTGEDQRKMLRAAEDFYRYVVEKHPHHASAKMAQQRLKELQRLH